jgi:gliding motility-associated lipoprotein GldH
MRRKSGFPFPLILLVFILLSCNTDKLFQGEYTFEDYTWSNDEKIIFSPEINTDKSGNQYQLILNIRYITGFQYKFLNLGLIINRPDGSQSTKEISIQMLTDDKQYRGNGMGDYWDLDYAVSEPITIDQTGKYEFELVSLMGELPLNFINELGITIKPIKPLNSN